MSKTHDGAVRWTTFHTVHRTCHMGALTVQLPAAGLTNSQHLTCIRQKIHVTQWCYQGREENTAAFLTLTLIHTHNACCLSALIFLKIYWQNIFFFQCEDRPALRAAPLSHAYVTTLIEMGRKLLIILDQTGCLTQCRWMCVCVCVIVVRLWLSLRQLIACIGHWFWESWLNKVTVSCRETSYPEHVLHGDWLRLSLHLHPHIMIYTLHSANVPSSL